jgi:hypothetical protein
MSTRSITRSAAVVAAAIAPVIAFASPAQATSDGGCGGGGALIVHVSDSTPASGQQFVVRGKLEYVGMSTADNVIKVQTRRGGTWQPIKRARTLTDSSGHYRLRLILGVEGKRHLRVVAVGQDGDSNIHMQFLVTVH